MRRGMRALSGLRRLRHLDIFGTGADSDAWSAAGAGSGVREITPNDIGVPNPARLAIKHQCRGVYRSNDAAPLPGAPGGGGDGFL